MVETRANDQPESEDFASSLLQRLAVSPIMLQDLIMQHPVEERPQIVQSLSGLSQAGFLRTKSIRGKGVELRLTILGEALQSTL